MDASEQPVDCVQSFVYVLEKDLAKTEIISQLEKFQQEVQRISSELLQEYIWQYENLELQLNPTTDSGDRPHLSSQTYYGDAASDEWLIVFLLREASRRFPNIWIRLNDSDGEFLLIEAAYALPSWLSPRISQYRVWINEGKLKIIPISSKFTTTKRKISLDDALSFIQTHSDQLIHSLPIENKAFSRIADYPSAIASNLHYAKLIIPRTLACILHQNPGSIGPAIDTFTNTDLLSVPQQIFDATDPVTVSTRFTKLLYAKLRWRRPPQRLLRGVYPFLRSKDPIIKARAELGLKVVDGFNLLLSDGHNKEDGRVKALRDSLDQIKAGKIQLPTNAEMESWSQREDSEEWLDINFADLDEEMSHVTGTGSAKLATSKAKPSTSNQDEETAQQNMQKMVERFKAAFADEGFVGEDGGTGRRDMEFESDDDDHLSDEMGGEIDFEQEEQFTKMMRQMMGLPPDDENRASSSANAEKGRVQDLDRGEEEDEDDGDPTSSVEMQEMMRRMEQELKSAGALGLDSTVRKGKDKAKAGAAPDEESDDDEVEVDVDEHLLRNMMEAFKSQGGMAGPAGTMLAAMGIKLPRDGGEEEQEQDAK